MMVLSGPQVILILKILVGTVTVLLLSAVIAIAMGKRRLHGRINLVYFILTIATLLGFELLIQVIQPDLFNYFRSDPTLRQRLQIHLCFSVPAALLMPIMLFTGLKHHRAWHLRLSILFSLLWVGTFITGVFFLPHG